MGFEIDFLAVGDGESGGDAVTMRWGNLQGERAEQQVIVIDGGTKESGNDLVEHINEYYGTNRVDCVFSTHADADHSSGLTEVLERMEVGTLVMHCPWRHTDEMKNLFQNGQISNSSLKDTLKKALANAYELEKIAKKKNISVVELFSDDFQKNEEGIIILGPSREFYEVLMANFRETPQPKDNINLIEKVTREVKKIVQWITEHWDNETLVDPEENSTSAENNSSLIIFLQVGGKKLLFTGDAGVEALADALNKATSLGIDLKEVNFVQVPHHGSKHNVGPTILDALLGPKLEEQKHNKTAFVSVPKEGDPKHPSRRVVNAFIRRGVRIVATQGSAKRHRHEAPDREGWSPATPLSFYDQVEE